MAGKRARSVRLVASAVLLGIAGLFLALALAFYVRGVQWANEFSGGAGAVYQFRHARLQEFLAHS